MARRIQVTVSFPCLFLLAVLMAVSAVAEDKRPITEKDIFQFHWVADPQMSPDGSQVVFVQVNVNEKDNKYENSIWAVGSAAGRRIA